MKEAIETLKAEISKREAEILSLKQALAILGDTSLPVSQTRLSQIEPGLAEPVERIEPLPVPSLPTRRVDGWTEAEESKLVELFDKKFSYGKIAEQMGRSIGSVSGKASRMRLFEKPAVSKKPRTWTRWTPENERVLRAMYDKGFPDKDIAEKLGKSKRAVSWHRSKMGLFVRKRPTPTLEPEPEREPDKWVTVDREHQRWSKGETDKLIELFEQGLSDIQIADKLGRSRSGVREKRLKHGLSRRATRGRYLEKMPGPRAPGYRVSERKNLHKRWTSQDDKMLLGMRGNDFTFRQIALRLGRTASACRQRFEKLG